MTHRVVVTGLGIVSPLGNTPEEAYQNAVAGKNGISYVETEAPVRVAGAVLDFDGSKYLSKQDMRRQDRFSQFAIYASSEAYQDANVAEGSIDPNRFGVIIGSGMGGMESFAHNLNQAITRDLRRISPMFVPMIIPNMAAGNVAIALNAKGHVSCTSTACAAGGNAIGDAYRLIKDGYMDAMLAGGTEAGITPYTLQGFHALTALSTTNDINTASRPFDVNRDGFVLAEGAGMLMLESLESAQKRGAHIYAEVTGYGSTCDAYHITSPSGEGAKRAIDMAMQEAGLTKDTVDYVNAHGTSTAYNDRLELEALEASVSSQTAISSTKSMHGHALGGTAGIEAVLTIKTLEHGTVPATINTQEIEHQGMNVIIGTSIKSNPKTALSNSFGFGGHNVVLAFSKGVQ